MNSKLLLLSLVGSAVTLTGCTFPSSRHTISSSQANVMQNLDVGTVSSVREVNIEGDKTNLGLFGGGVVGGAAASGGRGVGGAVVQAAGSVVGAVAGQAVEEVATRKRAQEVTVRLDDGRMVVVTQESRDGLFRDGDRVRILNSHGGARVSMDVGR